MRLAARNTDSAEALRRSGLRVSGIGGELRTDAIDVAGIEEYEKGSQFDLILLAFIYDASAVTDQAIDQGDM